MVRQAAAAGTAGFAGICRVAAESGLREALQKLDYAATTSDSPAAFAGRIRREREGWAAVAKESGVNRGA